MNSGPLSTSFTMCTEKSLSNPGGMAGLQSIHSACQMLYPEQPNPLQVTARLKYWLGGPDPLDYISMYWNPGRPDLNIPPHWHYISFGLSDLHGDGRVHPVLPTTDLPPDHPSGFGIELTMRILGEAGTPPTWPAALLQRLATYIFATGNCLFVGDHVSWHAPLDGGLTTPQSSICHIIVAQDPQLAPIQTPLGKVQFVQIVGVTKQELRAAQRCGGAPLLTALSENPRCGGSWLITDMNRRHWVEVAGQSGPSDLSGVAANCQWEPLPPLSPQQFSKGTSELAETVKDEIKCILQKGLSEINSPDRSKVETDQSEQNEKNFNKDDCKMSTDSVKFIHLKSSTKGSQSELPSVKSLMSVKMESPSMSTDSFKMTDMENALIEDIMDQNSKKDITKEHSDSEKYGEEEKPNVCTCPVEDRNVNETTNSSAQCDMCSRQKQQSLPTFFSGVRLVFDKEAASLLPLGLQGRVLHHSHFTWSRVGGGQAITLLGSGVTGSLATSDAPIAALKGWLQILIPNDVAKKMASQLAHLETDSDEPNDSPPGTDKSFLFQWDTWRLNITVLNS